MLYGFEVINQQRIPWSKLEKLEYKALRKITGAYHSASQEKLYKIAGIETLDVKLRSMKSRYSANCLKRSKHRQDLEHQYGGRRWNDNHPYWFFKDNSGFRTPIQDIFNAAYEQNLANGKIFEKDLI